MLCLSLWRTKEIMNKLDSALYHQNHVLFTANRHAQVLDRLCAMVPRKWHSTLSMLLCRLGK